MWYCLTLPTIFKSNSELKISKEDLKSLFDFATSLSHFLFDGNIYDQGVAMGSPLGSVLANLHEKTGLKIISHLL